jgi:hypothetical protein
MRCTKEIKRLLYIQKNLIEDYFVMVINGDFKNIKDTLDRIYNIEKRINELALSYYRSFIDYSIVLTGDELKSYDNYISKYQYFNKFGCKENYLMSIEYNKYLRIFKSKGYNIEAFDHCFYDYYMSNLGKGLKNKTIFKNLEKDHISFINKA